jgi:hypothetical protein
MSREPQIHVPKRIESCQRPKSKSVLAASEPKWHGCEMAKLVQLRSG